MHIADISCTIYFPFLHFKVETGRTIFDNSVSSSSHSGYSALSKVQSARKFEEGTSVTKILSKQIQNFVFLNSQLGPLNYWIIVIIQSLLALRFLQVEQNISYLYNESFSVKKTAAAEFRPAEELPKSLHKKITISRKCPLTKTSMCDANTQ